MGNNYNMETVLGINNDAKGWWDHDSQLSSCCRFEGLGDGGWGDAWGEIAFWKRYPEGPRKNAIYAPKVTFQETITEKIGDKEVKRIRSARPFTGGNLTTMANLS